MKNIDEDLESLRPAVVQAKALLQAEALAPKAPGAEEIEMMSRLCGWQVFSFSSIYELQTLILVLSLRYTSSEEMYKDLLGVASVEAPSENELRFTYTSPTNYTLSLIFNPVTRQLADAKVRRSYYRTSYPSNRLVDFSFCLL